LVKLTILALVKSALSAQSSLSIVVIILRIVYTMRIKLSI
jgi:hypothetical protein